MVPLQLRQPYTIAAALSMRLAPCRTSPSEPVTKPAHPSPARPLCENRKRASAQVLTTALPRGQPGAGYPGASVDGPTRACRAQCRHVTAGEIRKRWQVEPELACYPPNPTTAQTQNARPRASSFGFRISDFLRISDFGLRIYSTPAPRGQRHQLYRSGRANPRKDTRPPALGEDHVRQNQDRSLAPFRLTQGPVQHSAPPAAERRSGLTAV